MNTHNELGTVMETLGASRFRVVMDAGDEIVCYLSGKMRYRNINIIVGDRVEVIRDPSGGTASNRIVWRR